MAPSTGSSLGLPKSKPSTLRRLSSMVATEKDLRLGGPVVVVPERMMAQRSSSSHHSGFPESMETARKELADMNLEDDVLLSPISSSPPSTPGSPITPVDIPTTDSFAFAFDIDGVLIRGGRPIPEAIEAMKVLNGENEYGMKVPYIFLTNGGGKTEAERCIDLSRQLDIEVAPAQFICGKQSYGQCPTPI
jgi:hypothetical protein